ncbi:hypothetical protein [Halorubrum glutamatedens]|uniref:hypothetical protein n=1 Tax=Halorubrum glutamatedens TaxID=2707018 RepID=UPI0010A7AA89
MSGVDSSVATDPTAHTSRLPSLGLGDPPGGPAGPLDLPRAVRERRGAALTGTRHHGGPRPGITSRSARGPLQLADRFDRDASGRP